MFLTLVLKVGTSCCNGGIFVDHHILCTTFYVDIEDITWPCRDTNFIFECCKKQFCNKNVNVVHVEKNYNKAQKYLTMKRKLVFYWLLP